MSGRAQSKAVWKDLSRQRREAIWADLANADAEKGLPIMGTLIGAPEEATAFLSDHLRAVRLPQPAQVARLVSLLDDETFAVREKASLQLEHVADLIEAPLRDALKKTESAETRKRLRDILEKVDGPGVERLRVSRAVEVLERLGTPAARKALEALARDAEWPFLKQQAKDAVARLDRRSAK
jgi:hypothetical protein